MSDFSLSKTRAFLAILMFLCIPAVSHAQDQDQAPNDGIEAKLDAINERLDRIEKSLQPASRDAGINLQAMRAIPKRALASAGLGLPDANVDTDRDGLTDQEEATIGTNPQNADTDGDALLDGWEVHGVNGIDLQTLGASPLRKDIFIEMDFMTRDTATNGLAPNDGVLDMIRDVFASALVQNPDGSRGISIHLERGNEVPHDGNLNPALTEFSAIKRVHFSQDRAPVFHYMIWADAYTGADGSTTSSGNAFNIPNSDFIVTLGKWNANTGGTDLQKVGTFIHELGHNLGLRHGGSDHVGYKPNHISVMNYSFQTRGISVNGQARFDFQPFTLPTLREDVLSEAIGLGGAPQLSGYETIIRPASGVPREVDASGEIDWNGNGTIDANNVAVSINGDNNLRQLLGSPNEWNSLVYDGGAIGSTLSLRLSLQHLDDTRDLLPEPELTEEMDAMLQRANQ